MKVISTIPQLREFRYSLQGRIGVVPTMGALHAGHLKLVETAKHSCDSVITTIFINPTQFAANEDLSKYPRDLDHDLAMLESLGVDAVFTPTPEMMYPAGYQTYIEVETVSQGLEGGQRPGHFRGVATVVNKLFNLTQADAAFFGQKDAQQVAVIRRMVYDLNMSIQIIVVPTMRETDGLAMSSRNVYLTPQQRAAAPVLHQALNEAAMLYAQGERAPQTLLNAIDATLAKEPLVTKQYVSVADAHTLQEATQATDQPLLISLAVGLGTTRLLDNIVLPVELNTSEGLTQVLGNVSSEVSLVDGINRSA
jgi:pantoate--beta-alanine ligase